MSLVTTIFDDGFWDEKVYTTSSNDVWRYSAENDRGSNAPKKYRHFLTLVSRSDGKEAPIEALFRNDNPDCMVRQFFTIGVKTHIFSNRRQLEIVYNSNPPGSLVFDLVSHSGYEEDIKLKSSDGGSFFINQFLFKSRSKVFQAILAHGSKEAREKKVEFEDIPSSVLDDLVNFLKTDKVRNLNENALALGYVADKFDLPNLSALVQSHLKSNVTKENFEQVSQLALVTKSPVLWTALARASWTFPRKN